jgi:hypothetical protein
VREGTKLKGRLPGVVRGTVGKRRSDNALRNAVTAIEARTSGARTRVLVTESGFSGTPLARPHTVARRGVGGHAHRDHASPG